MTKITKTLKLFFLTFICLISISTNVFAEEIKEYGVEINVEVGEKNTEGIYDLNVDVVNLNNFAIMNFDVESIIPKGIEALDSEQLKASKDYLLPNENINMNIKVKKVVNNSTNKNSNATNQSNNASNSGTGDTGYKEIIVFSIVSFLVIIICIKYKRKYLKIISIFLIISFCAPFLGEGKAKAAESSIVNGISEYSLINQISIDNNNYEITVKIKSDPLDENFDITTLDSDKDDIADYLEDYIGTDKNNKDTDGDGLTDYQEAVILDTDPLKKDSDDNGVEDGDEDFDKDGVTNLKEFEIGSDPTNVDTDSDVISDGDEVNKHGSNPTLLDSDLDKLDDNKELEFSTDIMNPDTNGNGILDGDEIYEMNYGIDDEENKDENVEPSLEIKLPGDKVDTVEIQKIDSEKDMLLSNKIPGYIGCAYDISMDGKFESAKLTFNYDEKFNSIEGFTPRIYYFDEENQYLTEVENQTVEGNSVSATLEHFSKYMLVDKTEFTKAWETNVKAPSENEDVNSVDISFVVDISASMDWNDSTWIRKSVLNQFVGTMEKEDKASLVTFTRVPTTVSDFISDKNLLSSKINSLKNDSGYNSYSGTDGSAGLKRAQELFEINNRESNKYLVFLTDGEDNFTSFSYDDYINYAIKNRITTYTIGLGNSINNSLLRKIANTSGGKYFNAEQADDLFKTFSEIKQDTIDYKTDSNHDGISDYYTKRIYDGILKLGTGISLKGIDLSINADYDGDGLLNGEEITIYEYKDRIYIKVLSDPTLPDTDYDGLRDDVDPHRMNNGQTVKYVADDRDEDNNYSYDVSLKLDYRWFFDDNTKFNKDLCNTSLLFAGMAYYRSSSDTSDSSDRDYKIQLDNGKKYGIMDTMKYLGLEDVKEYNLNSYYKYSEHLSQFNIGHRKVTINGETKNIVTIFVRGTFGSLNEWTSNFDIGDTRENVSEWTEKRNHKGFDITANRILDKVNNYINTYVDSSNETVFWVTGHSRGAAISNIIGAKLEDQGKKTFTYTFAAPNTTTKANIKDYKSIFNVVNEDDFTPYVPMSRWGFGRYGRTATLDMTLSMQQRWYQITDNDLGKYNYQEYTGLITTVVSLSQIINHRNQSKEYTCSCHGDGSDNSIISNNKYVSSSVREGIISKIPSNAIEYCEIYTNNTNTRYNYELKICQSSMFFMQILAAVSSCNMEPSDFALLDIASKYESAKLNIIISKVAGIEHPHYIDTYYILSEKANKYEFK